MGRPMRPSPMNPTVCCTGGSIADWQAVGSRQRTADSGQPAVSHAQANGVSVVRFHANQSPQGPLPAARCRCPLPAARCPLLRTSKAPIPSYQLSVRTKGRFARLGVGLLATISGLALVYMLAVYLGGALLRGVVWAIVLVPRAFIWVVLALQEGADGWAIAGRVAATVADALSTTQLALSVIALELVGAAALYVLQRLTRDEARTTRSKEAKP